VGLGCKALLVAAAMVCAAAPALAFDEGAGFTATDNAWTANGKDPRTVTIAPGETVTFNYPDGHSTHNVDFTGAKPDCTGLPPFPYPPQLWKAATCRFDRAGTYAFVCDAHAEMTGTVVVVAPTPSPTPTATPDPVTPGATPAPTPPPGASSTPTPVSQPATLSLKIASRQKGTRVRGSLSVAHAGSRLEVTVHSGKTKAGSWTKKSAAAGRVSFSVALDARTRKALRAKRHLELTVTVKVTAPGAKTLTTSAKATVSL
jgi:plastocyanin